MGENLEMKSVEAAVEQGDMEAQFNLGNMYYNGEGTEVNYEKALYWWEKAAEQGDADAQFNLGDMYYEGEGTEVNYEKALYWWKKAAEQGDAEAQFNLGRMYCQGEGTEVNYEKALYWWEKAAEQDDVRAQFNVGLIFFRGLGTEVNYEKALYWYEKAAEQGDAKAQFATADMYYCSYGEGMSWDKEKALYWFEKAAAQGNKTAQFKTGCMYYKGDGTKRSKEKALYWWEQAAAQGHERAQEYIKANSNKTQKTSVKNLSNTVELKDFSASERYENEYEACAKVWDRILHISVTADILPLEDMLPMINVMLKGLDGQKEAFFNDLVDSYLPQAEDWVLNLCEESEEDSTDEKRCFITDDYNEIYLPISKEDFLDSLNLSIYVSYDKDESDILVDGYINCQPDYFAGHSIEFIVDGKGNFEIEGLAG